MPGIQSTLLQHDLDFLGRIARAWDVEIRMRDTDTARADLAGKMLLPDVYRLFIDSLPENVREAWQNLLRRGGRQTWAEFSRLNGEIRSFGPAKRAREDPDLHPVSIAESLWYAGLIGRAFFRGASEPVEHVYIPDELLAFEKPARIEEKIPVRPAVNQSPRFVNRSDSALLDQLTDLLAALRMQREIPEEIFTSWRKPREFLHGLLLSCGLIDRESQPLPQALKTYFNTTREQALLQLYQAWSDSQTINELRMLPGLSCEGNWQNDPTTARRALTGLLARLETGGTWWSISSLISGVKETDPDFQRPAGDYDSWFIRDVESGEFLHGFESWSQVEGALLYFLLTGPLHWLGLVNLARGSAEGRYTAFQLVDLTRGMLMGEPPATGLKESQPIKVKDVCHFIIPVGASRMLRYQVGRFAELVSASARDTRYSLTKSSLQLAAEQDLHLGQLLQLLEKDQPGIVPAALRKMEQRWSLKGQEAGFERVTLLRFSEPADCEEFLKAAGARFNLEQLNPRTLLIQTQQEAGIIKLLNELGILVDRSADV